MGVDSFMDEYRFLSNFWPAEVVYMDLVFPSVENAYQAAKCKFEYDMLIFTRLTAGDAKKRGRAVEMRDDWDDVKTLVMNDLVAQKFRDPKLRYKLKNISGPIIEGNYWHDNYWGKCICSRCSTRVAQNKLGCILMDIRDVARLER